MQSVSKNLHVCPGISRGVSRKDKLRPEKMRCVQEEGSVSKKDVMITWARAKTSASPAPGHHLPKGLWGYRGTSNVRNCTPLGPYRPTANRPSGLQGYLTHKKTPPRRTLPFGQTGFGVTIRMPGACGNTGAEAYMLQACGRMD